MNPANGAKIQDPEKFAASSPTTSVHAPRLLEDTEAKRRTAIKMQRLQHFLFALLVITVLSVSFVCSSPNNIHHRNAVPAPVQAQAQPPAIEDPSAKEFQDLLESVEPASLHEVLHKHLKEKYQHGVYQEDKTAMEVVHQQNAEVARSLVELAKRQQAGSTNGTIATTTPTSTAVVTSTQGTISTLPPSSTVVAPASTSTAPQATESSTSVRTVPASTPSPSASSQGSSTITAPTQVVSSTSNVVSASTTTAGPKTTTKEGSTGASSSPTSQGGSSNTPASSTSPGASSTEGSQASSTADSSDSITQTSVYKTTLANGATSTVTSVTVVPGQAGEHSGGSPGSKTNTANPSLQTNGGSQKGLGMNIVVGALGLAAVVAL